MDASQVLQTVLSVIQAGAGNATAGSPPAPGSAANSNGSAPTQDAGHAAPVGAVQLLVTLLSMSAVRDWMKLLLIGAFLETCRRLITKSWESIQDYFWLTATFEMHEDPADWILHWAAQRKMFDAARHVEITSGDYIFDNMVDVFGNDEAKVAFYPSMDRKYRSWYKGRFMTIKREQKSPNSFTRAIQVLELRILSRNPHVLRELLMEARKGYTVASKNVINVYVTESSDRWKHVASQQKRPASSVILDPGVFELVLADARDFVNSKRWYASRGIPFRRGYLLYGAPGAGKTSMIHSLAGELDLNIYILSLTVMALDDNSLKSLIARLPEKCVLLIEDIDAAFHRGMKRNIVDPETQQAQRGGNENGPPNGPPGEKDKDKQDTFCNGVTLSGLLNALDGIAAQEGRILFATTNDYSALDPALLRPGRLDLHVEFQLASRHQARELFKRFFTPDEEDEKLGVAAAHPDSDEKQASSDSGYSSANSTPPAEMTTNASALGQATPRPSQLPGSVRSVYMGGMAHGGTAGLPRLSAKQAAALAERFADIVPPQAFSMATLQGYLMAYKVRPLDAIADAPGWVESKLREKATAGASQTPLEKETKNAEGAAAVA